MQTKYVDKGVDILWKMCYIANCRTSFQGVKTTLHMKNKILQ